MPEPAKLLFSSKVVTEHAEDFVEVYENVETLERTMLYVHYDRVTAKSQTVFFQDRDQAAKVANLILHARANFMYKTD